MSYEPLHHKYRPQTFAQLVGQDAIATALSHAMVSDRIVPAYLFSGPRGTGKTSSARILAKSLNCLNSKHPTPTPCGECESCREITKGSSLDVVEIDAASNTGVENIRELIERAQFAPVRSRYKVYVIDECLSGESLILTRNGTTRIDNPTLEGQEVLSYNETTQTWEFKPVLRWCDRGEKETLTIRTPQHELYCTHNHLIQTETGWMAAAELQLKTKIYSPKLNSSPPHWQTELEPVIAIAPRKCDRVYDLEVADNHNFVANGLLVHNCHMLSVAAFNALLKTLEEPPDRVVFVLATTDPQRVITTIISRCQRFDFRRIPLEAMVAHLKMIAHKEQLDIEDTAITVVAQMANGGLRDAESLLDQLGLLPGTVTVERVWELMGNVAEQDLLKVLRAIASDDAEAVIAECRNLIDKGREPLAVLHSLAGFYLNLLIAKTASKRNDLVSVTPETWEKLCQEASSWDRSLILWGQQHLKDSEAQIKSSTQPRLWLEVTLLGLLPSASAPQQDAAKPVPTQQTPVSRPPANSVSPQTQNAPKERDIFAGNGKGGDRSESPPSRNGKETPSPGDRSESPPSRNGKETPSPGDRHSPPPANSHQKPSTPSDRVPQRSPREDEEVQRQRKRDSWEQVLALQSPAAQALLSQNCELLDFDLEECRVELSIDKNLRDYLNAEKIANLEATFEQLWHQKVTIKVSSPGDNSSFSQTVSKSPPQRNAPPKEPVKKFEVPSASPPRVLVPPPQSDRSIPESSSSSPVDSPSKEPQTEPEQNTTVSEGDRSIPECNPEPSTPPAEDTAINTEVKQAALELAQLFEGEIIALDRDFLTALGAHSHSAAFQTGEKVTSPAPQSSSDNSVSPNNTLHEIESISDPEEPEEDDDPNDIPF